MDPLPLPRHGQHGKLISPAAPSGWSLRLPHVKFERLERHGARRRVETWHFTYFTVRVFLIIPNGGIHGYTRWYTQLQWGWLMGLPHGCNWDNWQWDWIPQDLMYLDSRWVLFQVPSQSNKSFTKTHRQVPTQGFLKVPIFRFGSGYGCHKYEVYCKCPCLIVRFSPFKEPVRHFCLSDFLKPTVHRSLSSLSDPTSHSRDINLHHPRSMAAPWTVGAIRGISARKRPAKACYFTKRNRKNWGVHPENEEFLNIRATARKDQDFKNCSKDSNCCLWILTYVFVTLKLLK